MGLCSGLHGEERDPLSHDSHGSAGHHYLEYICSCRQDEYCRANRSVAIPYFLVSWQLVDVSRENNLQLLDGFDRGIFACAITECLLRGRSLTFNRSGVVSGNTSR
jgi:hypothetical protein